MRHLSIATALMLAAITPTNSNAGEEIDKTLKVQAAGEIHISVVRGEIEIESWDKAEVRVSGELDEATEEFIFETSGDRTVIKVEIDDGFFNKNWNADDTELTIYVPKESSIEADGVSTDFEITGVMGGLSTNSVSGDITVEGIQKSLDLQSVSGDIRIHKSQGKMQLASVSGDIDAIGKAHHFDATTVSGDVNADIGLADFVNLSTVSGDIEIHFSLAEDGSVNAGTVSGDQTLIFGDGTINAKFDINTGPGGDISNSITEHRSDSSFIGSEKIKFKSGNGNGSIELDTMSGSIRITD
jgi:DUF4097 and DUF4098 domain-containing protein YvlB